MTQQNIIRPQIGEYGPEKTLNQYLPYSTDSTDRPLPEEMFNYARSDTHFLLYIYDNMRNELIDKSFSEEDGDLLKIVMDRSKEETLRRYERPFYDKERGSGPMGWYNMLCRTPALFNREQFAVFRAIHQWRDQIAREEDESVHVIMPRHVLYNLAREMPIDMPTLLGCSHPISKSFKTRKLEILAVIKKARMLGHKGPDMKDLMHTMEPMTADRISETDRAEQVVTGLAIAEMVLPLQLNSTPRRFPAQSKDSRFWGSTLPTNMGREAIVQVSGDRLCLALPIPRLTAEIFEDLKTAGASANEVSRTSPGPRAEHQYVKNRKTKADEYIVKETGGPHKRKARRSCDAPEAVYSVPESNAATDAQNYAKKCDTAPAIEKEEQQDEFTRILSETNEEKRCRRLESKRLKKEGLRGNGDAKSQRPREVEPFNYANAPSVLYAQRDNKGKEISPYTKSSDAPNGMGKAMKEQEGKSFTFKG